jgi:tRNA nucleotidyltransferase (CCA-adding enzyme)
MTSGTARDRFLDYLRRGRSLRPILRGDDIIALGVPRGPAVGEMLARLRAAKLDGEVRTRNQEETLVRRLSNTDD